MMLLDTKVEVPDGYKLTGEYRPAKCDYWLDENGGVKSTPTANPVLILEKVTNYKLKGVNRFINFAAMDKSGEWHLYVMQPVVGADRWVSDGFRMSADKIGWEPPEEFNNDWSESLIEFTNSCKWIINDSGYVDCKDVFHEDCPRFCPQCGFEVDVR